MDVLHQTINVVALVWGSSADTTRFTMRHIQFVVSAFIDLVAAFLLPGSHGYTGALLLVAFSLKSEVAFAADSRRLKVSKHTLHSYIGLGRHAMWVHAGV